jgi:hypothetical protein
VANDVVQMAMLFSVFFFLASVRDETEGSSLLVPLGLESLCTCTSPL